MHGDFECPLRMLYCTLSSGKIILPNQSAVTWTRCELPLTVGNGHSISILTQRLYIIQYKYSKGEGAQHCLHI
jgi:hypothetical protein